jgi:MFS superfamily sulfate permease-like transporter
MILCLPICLNIIILPLGFLFFGTITHVEDTIRSVIEGPSWHQRPVQFLVMDMSLVGGIDMSSAEAFVRIHRLLSARCVTLVFCGFEVDSSIGKALSSVEVLGQPGVELFLTFNDAMECERAYHHFQAMLDVLLLQRDGERISTRLVQVSKDRDVYCFP